MLRVENRVALVTGAGSSPGLGSATAVRLAEEGATVYLTDIDIEAAEARAVEIVAAGGKARALRQDVTSAGDWDEVVGTIVAEQGRLDILVNNAGIAVLRNLTDTQPAEFAKQMDVNLTSVFLGTQRAVAAMRLRGGGSIINLSSVAGIVGVPGASAYTASKGAVRAFSKAVALETAKDRIRVNSVHPGVIWTNMQKLGAQDNADNMKALTASIPMGRMGEPVDVANCILFLASDESNYITGAEFVIDGGMTAQ